MVDHIFDRFLNFYSTYFLYFSMVKWGIYHLYKKQSHLYITNFTIQKAGVF